METISMKKRNTQNLISIFDVLEKKSAKGFLLEKKWLDVRKIFYKKFLRKALAFGLDPEDALQEIYTGILIRNKGKGKFDGSKSSFSHYVYMVCNCILSNLGERKRRSQNEILWDSDKSDFPTMESCSKQDSEVFSLFDDQKKLKPMFFLLLEGHKVPEIQTMLGISKPEAYKRLSEIKEKIAKEYTL